MRTKKYQLKAHQRKHMNHFNEEKSSLGVFNGPRTVPKGMMVDQTIQNVSCNQIFVQYSLCMGVIHSNLMYVNSSCTIFMNNAYDYYSNGPHTSFCIHLLSELYCTCTCSVVIYAPNNEILLEAVRTVQTRSSWCEMCMFTNAINNYNDDVKFPL